MSAGCSNGPSRSGGCTANGLRSRSPWEQRVNECRPSSQSGCHERGCQLKAGFRGSTRVSHLQSPTESLPPRPVLRQETLPSPSGSGKHPTGVGGGDAQPAHASLEETRISAPRAPTSHVPVSPGPWRGQSVGTEESMEKNSAVYTPPIPFASFLPKTGLEWGAEGVTVWTSSEG